jgi:glycosyltransferase involved in cell wall biosynthesis
LKISFLVARPTQFEAPFYAFAVKDPEHQLRVLFLEPDPGSLTPDPELTRSVDWGIDLLAGYEYAVRPDGKARKWLAKEITPDQCDVLITNGYARPAYLLAAALARRAGVATALRLDSVLLGSSASNLAIKRLIYTGLLKPLYDVFLGAGTLSKEFLEACGVDEDRIGLFPYAVDVDYFRQAASVHRPHRVDLRRRLHVDPDAKVILALAKLNDREGPWDLIRALSLFPAPVHVLIAGDGPLRGAMESLAASLAPTKGKISFLGYAPYPELPRLYATADLFVHAAADERWGVSVAEALACGLPVVTSSRVGSARDLIIQGQNGFTYPLGDAAQLAKRSLETLEISIEQVRAVNESILSRWDYQATWMSVVRTLEKGLEARL